MSYEQDDIDDENRRQKRLRKEVHEQSQRELIWFMGILLVFFALLLMAK